MSDVYNPPQRVQDGSHCASMATYRTLYEESVRDPPKFWSRIATEFHFEAFPTLVNFLKYNFDIKNGPIKIEWMTDAKTNICYNTLDRHLESRGSQVAFYWEGNDPNDSGKITYKELHLEVCKFANVLKSKGVKKGDRVAIYMPMITELVVAMLACARIGAVHSIVFGGYSAESLASRIVDAGAKVLVTADGVWRGKKLIHLLEVAENAIKLCAEEGVKIETNITVQHLPRLHSGGSEAEKDAYEKCLKACWKEGRDVWWHEVMESASEECPAEWMDGEDPLFMLYTSGSTGKPKGVLHSTAGYMLYAATTFKYSFDFREDDVYWCTADIGWITGHSYVTYGPLLNGATSVLFEGTPFYPTNDRFWEVIEKYKVTKFYTAPTAIRALMKFGEDFTSRHDLSSLKILGTVGEPINPEAWQWYHKYVGSEQCSIVDTYWQTETGGHVMTPLPGCTPTKPGSACFPFFGVVPVILHSKTGKELEGECEGLIAFKQPWPGMMRTVYGDHERFENTYFEKFPGYYLTGDGAKRDADGYIWITGRTDDMLNCSGHLMSTAQVESALIEHPKVAEAAVVSRPHIVKGECLYCFITPKDGFRIDKQVERELKNLVREKIAPFAQPDYIQEAPNLPKTRSGKIMRRILRKIAQNDNDVGDTSTMADESIVKILQQKRDEILQAVEKVGKA